MKFNRHSPISFKMLVFVVFAIINLLVVPVPAGAVTGFTLKAELRSSGPLTGCGPDIFLPVGVVSQNTVVAGVTCDASTGKQEGGSVLVFEEPITGWMGTLTQNQILYPSDPAADGRFGSNVDIDGNTMVVGSQRSSDLFPTRPLGFVYVFTRSGPSDPWMEKARLKATDGQNSWGWNPKIDEDVVIAGDSSPGVFGTRPGAVYVFVKPAIGWTGDLIETAKLVPSTTTDTSIRFGASTDIAGSVIAVSARNDNPVGTVGWTGRGYVFIEPSGGWSVHPGNEDAILAPSVTNDGLLQLGTFRGVVTDGETVVMRSFNNTSPGFGLYFYQKPATGWGGTISESARKKVWGDIDLDVDTLIVNRARAAGDYTENILLFERPASGWTSTLTPTDSFPHESNGQRVDASLDVDTAVIGQFVYLSSISTTPVLEVTKGDTIDPVVVGGDLTYTITVKNNGLGDVTGVTATDTLPPGVIYIGSSPAGDCTVDSIVVDVTTVTCTLRDLLEGELTSVQLDVTAPDLTGTITNTASVIASEISVPVIASENTEVVDALADLELFLSHGPEPVFVGSTLVYAVDVINHGPDNAMAVTVTVDLPLGTTFIEATARNAIGQTVVGACQEIGMSVVCDMETVQAGDTVEVNVDVTAPTTVGVITNAARVTSAVADPGPSLNTATDQTTVVLAGIDLVDSVNAPDDFLLDFGTVDVGISVAGTVNVKNNRSGPVAVIVNSSLVQPFSIASNTCAGGDLPAGVSCEVGILFEPSQSDVGGILSAAFELNVGGISVPFAVTGEAAGREADLGVTINKRSIDLLSEQYIIRVVNNGRDDAVGFFMDLDLASLTPTPQLDPGNPIGDLLVCTDSLLDPNTGDHRFHCELPFPQFFPANTTAVLKVTATLDSPTLLPGWLQDATVRVGADTPDPDESNNTATTVIPPSEGGGGRGSICPGLTLGDSDGRSNWPGGSLLVGMTSLLLWGWSRARRRTVRARR